MHLLNCKSVFVRSMAYTWPPSVEVCVC